MTLDPTSQDMELDGVDLTEPLIGVPSSGVCFSSIPLRARLYIDSGFKTDSGVIWAEGLVMGGPSMSLGRLRPPGSCSPSNICSSKPERLSSLLAALYYEILIRLDINTRGVRILTQLSAVTKSDFIVRKTLIFEWSSCRTSAKVLAPMDEPKPTAESLSCTIWNNIIRMVSYAAVQNQESANILYKNKNKLEISLCLSNNKGRDHKKVLESTEQGHGWLKRVHTSSRDLLLEQEFWTRF